MIKAEKVLESVPKTEKVLESVPKTEKVCKSVSRLREHGSILDSKLSRKHQVFLKLG